MAKKRRIPPTRYPHKLESGYQGTLIKLVRSWHTQAQNYIDWYIKDYVRGGAVLFDDDDNIIKANQLLQRVELMATTLEEAGRNDPRFTQIATKFVRSIDNFSFQNVKVQVGVIGLNPIQNDVELLAFTKTQIGYNVSLIKSMRTNYFDSLQKDIYRSITQGGGVSDITQSITKRTHMAVQHAKLIAVDQTGSILGQLNAHRATKAGAKYYIWRSSEDNRVRPRHRELDGTKQKYNDPKGGDNGLMPGEPIRCRCVAMPIFDDLY